MVDHLSRADPDVPKVDVFDLAEAVPLLDVDITLVPVGPDLGVDHLPDKLVGL